MMARYWRRFCRTSGALYDRRSWRCGENDRRFLLVTPPVLRRLRGLLSALVQLVNVTG